jgi:NAD(P)-dependent dehydrogenase (short-subunit alcohol dehydrogenase family)
MFWETILGINLAVIIYNVFFIENWYELISSLLPVIFPLCAVNQNSKSLSISLPNVVKPFAFMGIVCCLHQIVVQSNYSMDEITAQPTNAIFITGCSSGLGLHAALDLSHSGFTVYCSVRKMEDSESFTSEGTGIVPVLMDVTDETSIIKAEEFIRNDMKKRDRAMSLRALVNNAGIGYVNTLEYTPLSKLRQVYEVNVVGTVATVQTFLPLLREGREIGKGDRNSDSISTARIVNIGSVAGFITPPLFGAYSASKYALEAITDAWRLELSHQNIAISLVEPGTIRTRIQEKNTGMNSALNQLTSEQRNLYPYLKNMIKNASNEILAQADGPEIVTQAIKHAIMDRKPLTRYAVGRARGMPMWMIKIFSIVLPDRIYDHLKAVRFESDPEVNYSWSGLRQRCSLSSYDIVLLTIIGYITYNLAYVFVSKARDAVKTLNYILT